MWIILANSLGNTLTHAEIQKHWHKRTAQPGGWHCQDPFQKHYIKKKGGGGSPTRTRCYLDCKKPPLTKKHFFSPSNSSRSIIEPANQIKECWWSQQLCNVAVTLATIQGLPLASYQAVRESISQARNCWVTQTGQGWGAAPKANSWPTCCKSGADGVRATAKHKNTSAVGIKAPPVKWQLC